MPPGLVAREVVRGAGRSAHSERVGARWSVDVRSVGLDDAAARAAVARWEDPARPFVIHVERPGKRPREVQLRRIVGDVRLVGQALELDLRQDDGSAKPYEVVAALTELPIARTREGRYTLIAALRRPGAAGAPQQDEGSSREAGEPCLETADEA